MQATVRCVNEWEALIRDSCVPLSVTARTDPFEASLHSRQLDRLWFSTVQGMGHRCQHEQRHIRQSDADTFLLSVQRQGIATLWQDERAARIAPGDIVLYDSTRPFQWAFEGAFEQWVIRLPREALRYRLTTPHLCTARPVNARVGMGRIFSSYLAGMLEEQADSSVWPASCGRLLAEATLDLLGGLLSDANQQAPGTQTNLQTFHLNKAYAFIGEHLVDPQLSPELVASALGISARYLHRVFLTTDTSVGRYILQARLDGCAAHLGDPRRAGVPVSAIAFNWGFENASHFSRSFRQRFNMSPRDYRQLHLPG